MFTVSLVDLTRLVELVTGNHLITEPGPLRELTRLELLDLPHNYIQDLEPLECLRRGCEVWSARSAKGSANGA